MFHIQLFKLFWINVISRYYLVLSNYLSGMELNLECGGTQYVKITLNMCAKLKVIAPINTVENKISKKKRGK